MYLFGDYFIECIPEHVADDGWTAFAKISRRRDYRRFAPVTKVEYPTSISEITRFRAERAGVAWAKAFIAEHTDELEKLLAEQR